MAGSASGQDKANPVFWLATREGKMGLSCPLGISRFVPVKAKFLDRDKVEVHKNAKKKELGQYPAILTECEVNNAHIVRKLHKLQYIVTLMNMNIWKSHCNSCHTDTTLSLAHDYFIRCGTQPGFKPFTKTWVGWVRRCVIPCCERFSLGSQVFSLHIFQLDLDLENHFTDDLASLSKYRDFISLKFLFSLLIIIRPWFLLRLWSVSLLLFILTGRQWRLPSCSASICLLERTIW